MNLRETQLGRMVRKWRRRVSFGGLRRVKPISRSYGLARGRPIDRYYIERFLRNHAADIRGQVLEFGDDHYSREFSGGTVTRIDTIAPKVINGAPAPSIVADLTQPQQLPHDAFDCIICTQVLMFIADPGAAVRSLHCMLRPGGVLLLTVIQVGLAITNVPSFYVGMIGGFMIFIAVAIDAVRVRYFA